VRRLFTFTSALSLLLLIAVLLLWSRAQHIYGVNPVLTVHNHTIWADREELSIGSPRHVGWSVSYLWIDVALSILPLVWIAAFMRRRGMDKRLARGLCPKCGYDLRASRERCPECGEAVHDNEERQSRRQ
jgi:hypothetical protein